MNCKKCGKENSDGAVYCISCGQKLIEEQQVKTAQVPPRPVAAQYASQYQTAQQKNPASQYNPTPQNNPVPQENSNSNEKANPTLCLLSFLAVPYGFLAFCLYVHSHPKAAKSYVNAAALGLLAYILIYVFIILPAKALMGA